jgi:hypothetical protein
VTVRTVTEDSIHEVGEADDDIEPIDGGVKPEKSGRLPSPFSRAENRYSKGRPITDTQMQERVNDAYMLMLGGGAYRENAANYPLGMVSATVRRKNTFMKPSS